MGKKYLEPEVDITLVKIEQNIMSDLTGSGSAADLTVEGIDNNDFWD